MKNYPNLMTVLSRLFPVFLLLAAACSRAPEEIDSLEARQAREEAARALDEFEQELTDKVPEIIDIFKLETLRRQYRRRGGYSGEILGLLAQRKDRLIAEIEPVGRISPEAEILTSDYRKSEEGSYRLSLLFRVNKEFDQDYRLSLHGYVEQSHIPLLPPVSREPGFAAWSFEPLPPTSVWDIGEYVFVTTDFSAQSIPYYMKIGFSRPEEGRYGQEVDLGWKADLEEPEVQLIDRIANTEDIIELFELYRRCQYAAGCSKAVCELIGNRIELLLNEAGKECQLCPEATMLDFRFRMVGVGICRFYYLIKVNDDFVTDYRIYLRGYVDNGYLPLLPEDRREYKFTNWTFAPLPPTTRWPRGEKILITKDIITHPIPYRLKTGFYLPGGIRPGIECDLGYNNLSEQMTD